MHQEAQRRGIETADLPLARKSLRAGQSRDELQKTATLPGFEDTIQLNARLTLGFVLGIAYDERGVKDAETLLAEADRALYASKERGRNTFTSGTDTSLT